MSESRFFFPILGYEMTKKVLLDDIDLQLLEALQRDARQSAQELSESLGLSLTACYRRVRLLREHGAIEREVALVRPQTMGWPISMIVLVSLERDRVEIVDRIIQKLTRVPEVIEAWYVTGDHDLAVRIVARDMEHFDEWTRRILHSDENIKNFKTLVVLRSVKPLSPIPASRST